MALPSVRRLPTREASLQDRSRRRTTTPRHRGVNNFNARIALLINIEQGIQRSGLASGRPPGKNFQFVLVCRLSKKRPWQQGEKDSKRFERGEFRHLEDPGYF